LITDDDKEDRARVKRYLQSGGYAVLEAAGGEEALCIVNDPTIRIDLLLADVRMPRLNGCELANRVQLLRPDLRIMFVSGYSLEILAVLKLSVDRLSLISKSEDRNGFLAAMRRVLLAPSIAK
jgi:two-component system cell cycle sensor histidine kinase/response regulator CckA